MLVGVQDKLLLGFFFCSVEGSGVNPARSGTVRQVTFIRPHTQLVNFVPITVYELRGVS